VRIEKLKHWEVELIMVDEDNVAYPRIHRSVVGRIGEIPCCERLHVLGCLVTRAVRPFVVREFRVYLQRRGNLQVMVKDAKGNIEAAVITYNRRYVTPASRGRWPPAVVNLSFRVLRLR
jgi:hypothetical protein